MQVNRAATMQLETVGADAPIVEIAKRMRDKDVGLLLVVDGSQLLGVVTDRDVVTRAVAENESMHLTHARDIMSHPVICVSASDDIEEAATRMANKKVRRLVVLNETSRPVGVLSLDDIAFATRGDETAGRVLEEMAHGPAAGAIYRGG